MLRTLVGGDTGLSEAIDRAQRQYVLPMFPTYGMQEGGYVPAGRTVSAMLHGPELVVPLGANTTALHSLAAALQGMPGGAEGFRNYGSVNVYADTDRDTQAMRGISRALGVR